MMHRCPGRGRDIKTVLRLPELDQAKSAVLNSLSSIDVRQGTGMRSRNSANGTARSRRLLVKALVDDWIQAANLAAGKMFRRVNKNRNAWGKTQTEKAVWHVVREYARQAGIERLAPHDLRSTYAGERPQAQTASRLSHSEDVCTWRLAS